MGKSVSGGCVGLPAQPRNPRNSRPLSVIPGLIENNLAMFPPWGSVPMPGGRGMSASDALAPGGRKSTRRFVSEYRGHIGAAAALFALNRRLLSLQKLNFQPRSKRSRFITLVHAVTKSFTNFSFESAHA